MSACCPQFGERVGVDGVLEVVAEFLLRGRVAWGAVRVAPVRVAEAQPVQRMTMLAWLRMWATLCSVTPQSG